MTPSPSISKDWNAFRPQRRQQPTWQGSHEALRRRARSTSPASRPADMAPVTRRYEVSIQLADGIGQVARVTEPPGQAKPLADVLDVALRQIVAFWSQTGTAEKYDRLKAAQVMHKDAQQEIDVLARLEPNWDSYGGVPPSGVAISSAHGVLIALASALAEDCAASLAPWTIAPIHNGGLQLDWRGPAGTVEVEIGPDGALSYLIEGEGGEMRESDGNIPLGEVVRCIRGVLIR